MNTRRGPRPDRPDDRATEIVTNAGSSSAASIRGTGRELWRLSDENTQVKVPSPVIAGDLVIVTGGYPPGRRPIYAVRPGGSGTLTKHVLAWQTERGAPYTGTPLVHDGIVYVCTDNGILSAYDAHDRRTDLPAARQRRGRRLQRFTDRGRGSPLSRQRRGRRLRRPGGPRVRSCSPPTGWARSPWPRRRGRQHADRPDPVAARRHPVRADRRSFVAAAPNGLSNTVRSSAVSSVSRRWRRRHRRPPIDGRSSADRRRSGTGGDAARQLRVLWTYDAGDVIESSAAIADGVVYVGAQPGELHAVNLADGKPSGNTRRPRRNRRVVAGRRGRYRLHRRSERRRACRGRGDRQGGGPSRPRARSSHRRSSPAIAC